MWLIEYTLRNYNITWMPWFEGMKLNRCDIGYAMAEMKKMKTIFPTFDFQLRNVVDGTILPLELL